jgi:hypothetical protein
VSTQVTPEFVLQSLAAQGVGADPARAASHAALTSTLLEAAAAAFGELAFEEEPPMFVAELRRAAP